jgi:hypothetical protein
VAEGKQVAARWNNIPVLEYFERALEYIPQKRGVPLFLPSDVLRRTKLKELVCRFGLSKSDLDSFWPLCLSNAYCIH